MLYTDAVLEVRARLQELVEDFWQDDEVLRAINEGVNRFAQEEKWPYLYTVQEGLVLVAGEDTLTLTSGVAYERHFNLMLNFSGDARPRLPHRVHPSEGYSLRRTYYTDTAEPMAYYIASMARSGDDELQSIANTGSTTGTFTITFDGQTTGTIARGATAATVEAALKALSNIGAADVRCYGGPLGSAKVYVQFQRNLGAANVPAMTLGGTTTSMAVVTEAAGGNLSGQYVPSIRFVPAMTRDATIEYQYIRDPVTVSAPTTEHLDVPDEYAMGVVAYATGHLYLKELDYSQKAQEQFDLYQKAIQDAKRESRKVTPDSGLVWGREQPEWGFVDDDAALAWMTPPQLGP